MRSLRLGVVLESLELPLRAAVAEAARLGVAGVQADALGDLAPAQLSSTGRRELSQLLAQHQLEWAALHVPLRRGLDAADGQQQRLEHLLQVLRLCADLHCRCLVVPCPKIPAPDTPRGHTLRDSLQALCRWSDHYGVNLALEIGFDPAETVVAYLRTYDSERLQVTYDPANFLIHGHDPLAQVPPLARWIAHVHARDVRSASVARGMQEVPLGAGEVDWLTLMATLQTIEFQGFVTIERLEGTNRRADVQAGVTFLRRFLPPPIG